MTLGEADLGAEGGGKGTDLGDEIGEGDGIAGGGVDDGWVGGEGEGKEGEDVGGEGEGAIERRKGDVRAEAMEGSGCGVETGAWVWGRRQLR